MHFTLGVGEFTIRLQAAAWAYQSLRAEVGVII